MKTIVVLVNERPESRAALDWALHAATGVPARNGDANTAPSLYVVLGPATDIPGGPRYVSPALTADINRQLRGTPVPHEIVSEAEDPAHRVITLAEELSADLVVIGLQARSAALKLVIGSYARQILVDAPCPVAAVKK